MQISRATRHPLCRRPRTLLLLSTFALAGCSAEAGSGTGAPAGPVAHASGGMVVSGSAPATAAGVEVLRAGGNAVDAAVAAAFALAVAEPTQSGLGGRTQALWRTPQGTVAGIDATTEVPSGFRPEAAVGGDYGWGAVAIPGTVAGLAGLHEGRGRLPWAQVVAPAIRLAEEGFELSPGEAERLRSAARELATDEGARRHFLRPDGTPYGPGERLVQPTLAATLRVLATEGADAFYRGSLSRTLTAEMEARDGWVRANDLDAYRAVPAVVGSGTFRGLELWGSYLPASGVTTIEALQILDRLPLEEASSAERTAMIAHALTQAFEDRERVQGPADSAASELTSPGRAEARAQELRALLADRSAGTPSGPDAEHPNTTHLSVVDAEGWAVSMTQSLGPTGGARVASPGLGFLYASTLGYLVDIQPGDRPWSSQSPLIALRDGELAYVIGGAGSRRIISALVSTFVRLGVERMDLEAALAAPRLHPSEGTLTLETGTGVDGSDWGGPDFARFGFEIDTEPFGVYFARLNAIAVGADGQRVGVGDPRWPWSVAGGTERP
ncbi:MAG: gamma-glutamyltransferase [Gemmatimonadota bacterium]